MPHTIYIAGLIALAVVMLASGGCIVLYTVRVLILQTRLEWRKMGPRSTSEESETERAQVDQLKASYAKYVRRMSISVAVCTLASLAVAAWRQ